MTDLDERIAAAQAAWFATSVMSSSRQAAMHILTAAGLPELEAENARLGEENGEIKREILQLVGVASTVRSARKVAERVMALERERDEAQAAARAFAETLQLLDQEPFDNFTTAASDALKAHPGWLPETDSKDHGS